MINSSYGYYANSEGKSEWFWICPFCGKKLCEDGFTELEEKVKVHKSKCKLR